MQKLFSTILLLFNLNGLYAQHSFFTILPSNTIDVIGVRQIKPTLFKTVKLDVQSFKFLQVSIPSEESKQTIELQLPTPDGTMLDFKIFESKMMLEPLYSKYKEIRTYTAICKTNKFVTAKIDFTVWGFHAKIFDGNNTYFIDPFTNLTDEYYTVYYKRDFVKPLHERLQCEVEADNQSEDIKVDESGKSSYKTHGLQKREYRLALACTMEYSAAVGGGTPTKASVLSAMVTSMNRVNGVFEREFAIHENLIGNNDTLIYLPGGTDPYTNNSGSTMLNENQTNIDAIIGIANYDHGHVFSTGGGGIAQLGSYCGTGKARGVTGSSNPIGDPFDIDYVAHEMGHQLGGSHTFNSVSGSCSGNRSSSSAYEIGSGITIMAYAGICDLDNIQPHSDDFYNIRNLNQISTFLTTGTGNGCALKTNLTNKIPVFNKTIFNRDTIPYKTPFELIVKNASDTDNNVLLYCWEQYNRGGSGSAWNAKTTVAPNFRSFNPTLDSNRTFPQYKELILNTESYLGEVLPDTQRILTFKNTLRDMNNGYGAFNYSDDSVNLVVINTGSELFRVTSQNANGISYAGNSMQQVNWNVATTTSATINCPKVDIYVSVDSGKTWYLRLANTNNDGSEMISIPNTATTSARVKVKGANNVFFDLNDNWFTITKVADPAGVSNSSVASVAISPNPTFDFINYSIGQNEIKKIQLLDVMGKEILVINQPQHNIINTSTLKNGIYILKITSTDNKLFVGKVLKK
jgi:hypothetical protein